MGEGIPGGMLTPTANGSEAADDLHVAPRPHNSAPSHLRRDDSPVGALSNMHHEEGRATGVWGAVREYLPRGNTLDPDVFHRRHLLLCWILGLHIPALFAFGVWQGFGVEHSALEMVTPAACLLFARLARNRRLAAFFVTAGLVFCSSVLVHLSNGTIEAHFHFFILIGLIALYQDWVPFLWNVIFTVISHGLGSSIAADLMFNHSAAQNRPWSWAAIHGVSVLAACVGVIIFWKNTELEQHRNTSLAAELARAELTAVQSEAAQRQTMSELLVNLARRNQSLLDRQLEVISDLEQRERQPEALSELFKLDHLATRIRRNAESLLVLAGDDPPRRWGRPVALAEVVRAAAAEVEDYGRVEVLVNDHLEVAGRAVADLAHLLAELIENATVFSPPNVGVRVRSYLALGDGLRFVISIEDNGIGMSEEELRAANLVLSERPEVDLRRTRLGFHVVGRLAQRYGLHVHLATTPGGGVTALVSLPEDVVSEQRVPAMAGVGAAPFGPVGFAPPPAPSSSPGVPASVPVAPRSSAGLPALPPPPPPPPPSYAPPSFAPPPPPPPPPPATDPWPPMPVPRATIATELPFLPAEAPPPPPPPPPAARVDPVPASPEDAPAPAPGPTPAGPRPGSSSTAPAPPTTAPADSAPPAPMDVAAPAATRPAGPDPTEDPAPSPVVPPGTGWPASNADPAPPPEPGWPAPGADWTWPAAIPADSAPPVPAGFPPSSPAVPADPSPPAAAPPAALSVEEAALLAAVPHEALPNGEVVSPERPEPAQTSGLARRVPGRALAEPLRRAGDPDGSDRVAPVVLDDSDRARMRTMLSRFQAGQEAGRAAVEQPTETGDPATAPPDPPPPEDDP